MKFRWRFRYRLVRESLFESIAELRPLAAVNVLDVGCGLKRYQELFEEANYVGLDIPNPNSEGSNADIYGDATNLPFRGNSFDCVICTEVIEHGHSPDAVIKQIEHVLKSGGVLVISAPFFWPLHEEPRDYFRFSKFGLRHLLEQSGFRVIGERKRGGFASVWVQMLGDYLGQQNLGSKKNSILGRLVDFIFAPFQFLASRYDKCFESKTYAFGWTFKAQKVL